MHDAGKHVPAIENRPSPVGFAWLWEAFVELGTCRHFGMGAGPIPWTAIQRYVEVEELGPDEAWVLHQVVRELDQIWLEERNKEQAAAQKPAKSAPPRPGRGRLGGRAASR